MIRYQMTIEGGVPEKLAEVAGKVREAEKNALEQWADDLANYIREDKLTGGALNVRSGDLRDSVYPLVEETDDSVSGGARGGGGLVYAKIHEYGGDIYPVHSPYLVFCIDGHWVRTKHVHMPERSYMRSGLQDKQESGLEALRAAMKEAIAS